MSSDEFLQSPLQLLKGVGPRRASDLATAGLKTVEHLLLRLPRCYEDRSRTAPIANLQAGEEVTIEGEVLSCGVRRTRRRGFSIFEILVGDDSGSVRIVFLNQPFLKDVLSVHQKVAVYGKLERRTTGSFQFTNPHYEVVDEAARAEEYRIHTGRIVPVYERISSVSPRLFRTLIFSALGRLTGEISDPLPEATRKDHGFRARRSSLVAAHFPPIKTSISELNNFATKAQQRLIFEEFFFFQLGLAFRRQSTAARQKDRNIVVNDWIRKSALSVLPFRLTGGQKQSLKDIVVDLQRSQPMNRLLQGDVGSGKTIVALLAALVVMENGYQVAVMSPTEILTEQHYFNLSRLLKTSRFRAVKLTGAMTASQRNAVSESLAVGEADLVVGTHALVQEEVKFKSLGLVVIDEQHRFGVMQRATLGGKGVDPDVLVMTATPIPRTLALTSYGDLDVSVIRELPPGRKPVNTHVRPASERKSVYTLLDSEIENGRQGYIVYPLIEKSEKTDLSAAKEMADRLRKEEFCHRRVELLHGRMASSLREVAMKRFVEHQVDLLVTTTVIEVGVDVSNASIMIVENAERFGLSQLHQLRGRVGRGEHQSYCVLLYQEPLSETARARLEAMGNITDGFELSERDLVLRGPGDFFGTRQHGLPMLRVGDLLRDHELMENARRAALKWIEQPANLDTYTAGWKKLWSERFQLIDVG
jgi:ATP-dependent DNA helicase RecG